MKVLVTGGAGFIGSFVVDLLLERGFEPVVYDCLLPDVHPSNDWPDYLNPDVHKIRGDVLDQESLAEALSGCEVVIHLAAAVGVGESAYEPVHYVKSNTLGTASLWQTIIESDSKPKKVVVAGSMSSYGEGLYVCEDNSFRYPGVRSEENLKARNWEFNSLTPKATPEWKEFDIQSVYAQTKRDQEDMSIMIGEQNNIPVVVPRFFNVYGPRQQMSNPYTGVAAIFNSMILNGEAPRIYEDGGQSRDFIHVEDVAEAVVRMATEDDIVGVFNVGTGKQTTILELAQTLIKLHGSNLLPNVVNKYRVGDIRHCYSDNRRLRGYLPDWKPRTPEVGLADLVQWAKQQRPENKTQEAHNKLVEKGLIR